MARKGCDGETRLPSGEKESSPVADLDNVSDVRNGTTGASILDTQTSATQDISYFCVPLFAGFRDCVQDCVEDCVANEGLL